MFSGSSKMLLWIAAPDGNRLAGLDVLRLAPDAHYLSPGELAKVWSESSLEAGLEGLAIGSYGHWMLVGDPASRRLKAVPVEREQAISHLAGKLKDLPQCRPGD